MHRLRALTLLLAVLAVPLPARADTLSGDAASALTIADFVTGLGQVTDFRFLPGGDMVIIQKTGEVRIRTSSGALVLAGTYPVSTTSEQGLLGVEVDPDFGNTRRLFFYYSLADSAGGNDLNRHRVVSVGLKTDNTLDFANQRVLVQNLRGPANHDGGGLAIGPDGKLYIGVGDTGCNTNQPPSAMQVGNYFATCLSNGNGKLLRVELDGSIPADNPLVSESLSTACGLTCGDVVSASSTAAPRTEIYAWGLRNPFRFTFDRQTGKLWLADVGEVTFEEVNLIEPGKHYGWPWREGNQGFDAGVCEQITPESGPCTDPKYFCAHGSVAGVDGECGSITGGTFVADCSWPDGYRGNYFFADNVTGLLFMLTPNPARDGFANPAGGSPRTTLGTFSSGLPVALQTGPDGALYIAVLDFGSPGRIVRVGPKTPRACQGLDGGDPDGGTGKGACGCDAGVGSAVGGLLALAALGRRRRRSR